jgi:hypothetical protein
MLRQFQTMFRANGVMPPRWGWDSWGRGVYIHVAPLALRTTLATGVVRASPSQVGVSDRRPSDTVKIGTTRNLPYRPSRIATR